MLIDNTASGRGLIFLNFNYEIFLQHCLLTHYSNTADIPKPQLLNEEPDRTHFIKTGSISILLC